MSSPAHAGELGLVLDRYRPLRPLGRGASGSVWLARDERTGLDVALKIVTREGKREARAAREAEAAARLRHPRCVRAYDFGGDAGHIYIAYEYVQGRTLREALRAGDLTDAQAIEAAGQVLDALAHAHGNGIVHRDVKPSNVLLEHGEPVSIRLLDFGLAQLDEADTLTAVGDVPGTLAYIAPERLAGGEATEASDIWAVGVMLWEALAGTHPFWGVPLPQVAAAIESGAPPLARERPDLAKPLLLVVSHALDPTPRRRPSAATLAADLRAARSAERRARKPSKRKPNDKPVVATPTPVPVEARLVPAALAGVAALMGGLLLPFWPPGLVAGLVAAAALTTLRWPRLGLAIALFVPLFPLGNVAAAAAVVYGALALGWLALSWRDPRAGLAFCAGPLLAPIGGLGLLPLAVQPARGPIRHAANAAVGVFAAAVVAGLRSDPLPLAGGRVDNLGIAGSERPAEVGTALITVLAENRALAGVAVVLGASAALLPYVGSKGPKWIAAFGLAQLAGLWLAAPSAAWLSLALGTTALCTALAFRTAR
jgi:eukaryotic-like serine/threonine-protein kinase